MTKRGWIALTIFTGLLIWLCIASAPASNAAQRSVGIPGVDVCPKTAPYADGPETGLAGLLGERPVKITTDITPEHIWSTGGFAGLDSHVYDLGCAIDPTSWMRVAGASSDSTVVNAITSIGNGVVSLTDSVDRRSWQPGWITSFLDDFAQRATGVVNDSIILPFLALGLIAATGLLLYRAHDGDVSSASMNVGWVLVVLTLSGLIMLTPLFIASNSQAAAGGLVAMLNNGDNPSDAATNQIVKNVQYQGWLRRNFGSVDSDTSKTYGPRLLASTRVSWAEQDAITALPKDKQADAREALVKRKAAEFKDIAEKIKEKDPTAYRHLTGAVPGSVESLVELAFVFASCGFRLATAILMIIATISIVLLAVIWLLATPILVLPRLFRFSGQELGMGLVNSAVKAVGYVLMAALGSWAFGVYLQAALAPGMSLWWSLLLLVLGSGIAWTTIRPDRKALSIISLGRVEGYGYVGSMIKGFAMAYVGGRIGGRAAGREIAEEKDEPVVQERLSEDTVTQPLPRVVHADIYTPSKVFTPETPTTVDGEGLPARTAPVSLPSGIPVYERGPASTPPPPPDAARSPYEPYERSDDNEGANR